jgi:hypothetical protein
MKCPLQRLTPGTFLHPRIRFSNACSSSWRWHPEFVVTNRIVTLLFAVGVVVASLFIGLLVVGHAMAGESSAVPTEEIFRDWMMQDHGTDVGQCFVDSDSSATENAMVLRVLDELVGDSLPLRARLRHLESEDVVGKDPRWKSLYLDACWQRRAQRLAVALEKTPHIVFTRHYDIGGSHYAYTEGQSDAQAERHFVPGSALCVLDIDGRQGRVHALLEDSCGVIRDPDVSYDGQRVLFAWKKSDRLDDYHLYEMDVRSRQVRQLTFGLGFADYEGVYLPTGDIMFNSTRCVQIVDCWWTEVSNLYCCDADGNYLRRVTFDQVHTNYPQVLPDGRVIYTRWDYNDRGQIYPQPLFQMNADGTNQTEYYGNNSWFPTTILHARGIPGTQKLVAVLSGHHSHQRGKLAVIDPTRGQQEAAGIQLVAPERPTPAVRVDAYGQDGDQFQYPFALTENEFLVTYDPIGGGNRVYKRRYGIYWMDRSGRRELLTWTSEISSNQPVPLVPRPRPHIRPSQVVPDEDRGVYYLQDIYAGPGLQGVPRDTVEKLRVVALEFRAAGIGSNRNDGPAGAALISTPVAIGNGTWDVKRVLGHAKVHADGSACFRVPAKTPVYFQAVDQDGHVVQTMRSWSTLQPGESLSCVGCHEPKSHSAGYVRGTSQALAAGPQELEPFYGPARGFSFQREIQPILNRHCVRCHHDRQQLWAKIDPQRRLAARDSQQQIAETSGEIVTAFSLLEETTIDSCAKRNFSDAYLSLTNAFVRKPGEPFTGRSTGMVNWINIQESPAMLSPYQAGSAKSEIFDLLRQGHYATKLDQEELDKLACWIDLLVPYCGDYEEANAWSQQEKDKYAHFSAKRRWMAKQEAKSVKAGLRQAPPVPQLPRSGYRNLACQSTAELEESIGAPRATSNSEYRGLPYFSASAAIDGQKNNRGHGPEFPSWGPEKRTDVWWQVDFGRAVRIDRVTLYIRADFPHDAHWHSATLLFSDGSRERIRIGRNAEPQHFSMTPRTITWMRITDLVQAEPLGWCGLTEVEVWGRSVSEAFTVEKFLSWR